MLMAMKRLALLSCFFVVAACDDPPPGRTFYERNIQPILTQSCSGNTSGCHRADPEDPFQFAAGNFDVTSFENVQKRRDLLEPVGPYQVPPMLIKAVGPGALSIAYGDEFLDLDILHNGGANLEVGSDAYLTLLTWLENGATENGLSPPDPPATGTGGCATALPSGFDPLPYSGHADYDEFVSNVQPILERCSNGSCHGAPQADFYITCGDDADQLAFNFAQARAFVDDPVDESQILQVPLAVGAGGVAHTGGDQFDSRESEDYTSIKAWADKVGPILFGEGDPGREFFADNVQPLLITRGCSFTGCHSPAAFNDFKVRTGSQGFYSAISLERNYELMRDEFMAVEYPDARRGRAVAKTLLPSYLGIRHRGGAVLETPGGGPSDPALCPATFDPTTATAFCTIQEWVDIERAALIADGEVLPLGNGNTVPIVYVDRAATHVAAPLEFDTYQPGSDLMVATATIGAGSAITTVGGGASILGGCAGFAQGTADVRAPDVNRDGNRIAFAMRTSVSDPLGVWAVDLNGDNCVRLTPAVADVDGIKIHNFDPAWSPDGAYVVFASTRGRSGPSVSRKLFLPQSDLWRMRGDGSALEQVTFLTNSEMSPQFMREGRTIMTTEKVSDGFYQLAGRRQNWDLTDYHPLLAQRAQSPYGDPDDLALMRPSFDYQQATDIREDANNNFLVILSDPGARGGAGTLGIFNRSVGPMEAGRDDPGFAQSLVLPDPDATGRVGSATDGAYRNPFGLPDGQIMVSYTGFSGDLGTATSFDWDVVAIDPQTGARTTLIGGAGAQVDAVLALKYPARVLYENRRQLVFGGEQDPGLDDRAVIHMPDAPMVFTLLTGNLRRAHPVDEFRAATQLAIYVEDPAPPGTSSGNGDDGSYSSRTLLGRADLRSDGSVKVEVPSGTPLIFALEDEDGDTVVTMTEEHQVGPGERVSMGVVQELFDAVCGGCHGSVSGEELDIQVRPDALTGASTSLSATESPVDLGN